MATSYKVLGQVDPGANTDVNVYTVPAATETIVSTFVIANLQTTAGSFRIAIRPSGATLENKHYIAYDVDLPASDSVNLTLGATMSAGDVVTVRTSLDNVAFSVFGSEIS